MANDATAFDSQTVVSLLASIDRSLNDLSAVARLPHVYSELAIKSLIDDYGH